MAARTSKQALQSGGLLWGPKRVRLGISIRQLATASGINRGMISLMETGRMVPTSAEYDAIMAGFDIIASERQEPA